MDTINQIGEIASGILQYEFDFIEDPYEQKSELNTISGSLNGLIGELNISLNQNFCFTGSDGDLCPRLGNEETSILQEMYLRDYNTKQARKILRGTYNCSNPCNSFSGSNGMDSYLSASSNWTELKEGDTTIKRPASAIPGLFSNRLDLSKNFKALADESEIKIKDLAYAYNMYGAVPRQVAGSDAPDIDYLLCQEGGCETFEGHLPIYTGIAPSGIDLSGISPSGINSSGINSSGINSSGINSSGINSSGINSSGINSSGINSSGINYSGINYSGINYSGMNYSGMNYSGVDISGYYT